MKSFARLFLYLLFLICISPCVLLFVFAFIEFWNSDSHFFSSDGFIDAILLLVVFPGISCVIAAYIFFVREEDVRIGFSGIPVVFFAGLIHFVAAVGIAHSDRYFGLLVAAIEFLLVYLLIKYAIRWLRGG